MDEFQGVAGRRNRMLALPRVSFKVRMWGPPPLYDLEKKKKKTFFFLSLSALHLHYLMRSFFTFFFSFFGLINWLVSKDELENLTLSHQKEAKRWWNVTQKRGKKEPAIHSCCSMSLNHAYLANAFLSWKNTIDRLQQTPCACTPRLSIVQKSSFLFLNKNFSIYNPFFKKDASHFQCNLLLWSSYRRLRMSVFCAGYFLSPCAEPYKFNNCYFLFSFLLLTDGKQIF